MTTPQVRVTRRPLVLRNCDFALVWAGQVLSQGGTRMYQIGVVWWLLTQVDSPHAGLAAGAFLLVGALPTLVLAPVIGRVLTRVPSKTVMLRAEVLAAVTSGGLALLTATTTVPAAVVYVAACVLAVCQAFFDPCLTKSVPELVDEADIESAVGFESSTQSLANFGGAVVGAVLIGLVGFTGAVALNATTYVVSAVCLALAGFRPTHAVEADEPGTARLGLWRLLASMPRVRTILVCFAVANFGFGLLADHAPVQALCLIQAVGLAAVAVVLAWLPTSTVAAAG